MIFRRPLFNSFRRFNNSAYNVDQNPSSVLKNIIKDFKVHLTKIIDNSLEKATFIEEANMKKRIKTVSEYYASEVYPVQGEILIHAFEMIEKPKSISDELIHQIQVIVTTMEMIQFNANFWDDFDDNATVRGGKPCWHLVNNNGNLALIDACLMQCFINEIVRHNIKGELRDHVLSIHNRNILIGNIGQCLDKMAAQSKNYEKFTLESYNIITKNKSSFYTVKAPVLYALMLSNKFNEETYQVVNNVLTDLGILVQIHVRILVYYLTNNI